MSQKNETTVLVLAALITLTLAGGFLWWLTQGMRIDGDSSTPKLTRQQANTRNNSTSQSYAESLAQVSDVPAGLFSYGGSTTWAPIRAQVDPLIETVWPQFQLRYTQHATKPPGSGTGIAMLLDNQLAFAQSSRSLKEKEYQQAEQRGFSLREIPVAIDGIAVAVNPQLDISGLTVTQLQQIYTGEIVNWSEVGGSNVPIIPYSRRPEDSGTIEFFVENVMGGEEFGGNIEFIPTTTQALRRVSQNLGGIYYASAPEVVDQCSIRPLPIGRRPNEWVPPYQEPLVPPQDCPARRNQLNGTAFQSGDYPITRRLFVIVKENNQIDEQAGNAYAELLLTDQGQELIEKTGFVRIR